MAQTLDSGSVWSRSGTNEIAARTYNAILAGTIAYGLVVFGLAAQAFLETRFGWLGMLLLFGVTLAGSFIAASTNPFMNGLGLTLIAGGMGALCGPMIGRFSAGSVTEVALMTMMVTLVLGAAGWLYPKSLENYGTMLFVALIGLAVAQFVLPFVFALLKWPMQGLKTTLDWIGVVVFSGYIIFDFNRAQQIPKTVDNAMDSGIAVFLDIINLFLRLLSLFGRSDD